MSDFLQFKVETDLSDLEVNVAGGIAKIEAALVTKLDLLNVMLQGYIQGEKLSGQVLKVITGKLIRSVEIIPAVINGEVLEGGVQAGGGVAFYAKFQEEGTAGPYEILPDKAKALAFIMGGKQVFFRRVMHPGLEGKHFMRDSVEEKSDEIIAGLQAVPGEVLGQ